MNPTYSLYNRFALSPPSGFAIRVGGNKGRPTGPELMACSKDPNLGISPCTPARPNLRKMIKTNDWWYQKGSNSSTTLMKTTGGSYGAIRRRT